MKNFIFPIPELISKMSTTEKSDRVMVVDEFIHIVDNEIAVLPGKIKFIIPTSDDKILCYMWVKVLKGDIEKMINEQKEISTVKGELFPTVLFSDATDFQEVNLKFYSRRPDFNYPDIELVDRFSQIYKSQFEGLGPDDMLAKIIKQNS